MSFITSRLATSVNYTFYTKGANNINVVTDTITVKGGADVINKKSLETPQGVVTELTDEQIDKLKSHPVFKQHLEGGYVAIVATVKEAKKVEDVLKEYKSKQLTPKDYTKKGKKTPKAKKD